MPNKKTNVEFLRELIEKDISDSNKDEAFEFLDAIQGEIEELENEVKDEKQEGGSWEARYDDLKDEFDELESKKPDYEINSLQDQQLMDAFYKFVDLKGPLEAERILDELNKAPYLQAL